MFKTKYNISLLDSKWNSLKRNINLPIIPRKGEFIFFSEHYYEVLNVVHIPPLYDKKQDIFIIINEISTTLKP